MPRIQAEVPRSTNAAILFATSVFILTAPGLMAADSEAAMKAFREKDYATAYKEWKPAAEQGDASAQFNLGLMYARGLGVRQDIAEAMRLYQLSAAQGNAMAEYRLGFRYAHGWGVQQDYAEASRWYQMAA
ncbi:MAG: tetratricopeptide repeat protein, partial [Acidobacteriota bacterium]